MTSEHSSVENYTVTEHETECRKSRMLTLQQLRQPSGESSDEEMDEDEADSEMQMEEDEEEEGEECEGEVEEAGVEDEDGEEEDEEDGDEDGEDDEGEGESEEDVEDEVNSFPISVSIRQRRNLLREAGCQLDLQEREDCQFIRVSREGIT